MTPRYAVPPLSPAERALVEKMNRNEGEYKDWNEARALRELTDHLQVAVEVELATIPIYLGTYYTINRTVGKDSPEQPDAFPRTDISRFADEAGALIMSVAVEEMLHMSLSSNVLFSLGVNPRLYRHAPADYPASLPLHRKNVPQPSCGNDTRNIPIPLGQFSFSQLTHFLAIEFPAPADASPESSNWDTIGQIYSYIRCIIESRWISDECFQVRNGDQQIKATEYSPNSIDTVYPTEEFNFADPPPAGCPSSAQKVAAYASNEDSHVGASQLLQITTCEQALEAIATISFQGEGFNHEAYDDPECAELSHYYKFLTLQSHLVGYDEAYLAKKGTAESNVAVSPEPPPIPGRQYSPEDLQTVIYPAPENPVSWQFTDGREKLVDIADGLFQYMLIMTETTFLVPSQKQKIYFNRTMHQSMIWVLDKLLQSLREIRTADGENTLCATFANINLGTREQAFGNLTKMIKGFQATCDSNGSNPATWFTQSGAGYYLDRILELPDVSSFWDGDEPASDPPLPAYLGTPSSSQGKGTGGKYVGVPRWPLNPPADEELPVNAERHACMGLNSCRNQGRTVDNDCAGQGYCSTALQYNPTNPDQPQLSDHTCHVLNDCRNQGGCGLYGTEEELKYPGRNTCQSQGSCATPINAERFITDGDLKGTSVWLQARQVFTKHVWPGLCETDSSLPSEPPQVPGSESDPDLFKSGPVIGWIEAGNAGKGMTACGASGMSGAGSCA